jgi:hypothetical protein
MAHVDPAKDLLEVIKKVREVLNQFTSSSQNFPRNIVHDVEGIEAFIEQMIKFLAEFKRSFQDGEQITVNQLLTTSTNLKSVIPSFVYNIHTLVNKLLADLNEYYSSKHANELPLKDVTYELNILSDYLLHGKTIKSKYYLPVHGEAPILIVLIILILINGFGAHGVLHITKYYSNDDIDSPPQPKGWSNDDKEKHPITENQVRDFIILANAFFGIADIVGNTTDAQNALYKQFTHYVSTFSQGFSRK